MDRNWNWARSNGWIGFAISRHTDGGGWAGWASWDQRTLFNSEGWSIGFDDLDTTGFNSGLPLSAQVDVDNAHFYVIWVTCGGAIGTVGGFFMSVAHSGVAVTVPSITTELF